MRDPSLRQLEALMAVIETGTVSHAAAVLRISQSAASKLIQDLEADTGLQLFERQSAHGRLSPTDRGMRLYEEVQRIFGGVRQLARAVEAIRREEHGHLVIGAMPALSGPFLSRVLAGFRSRHPEVFISIEAQSSQYLTEAVLLRRLDVAIVTGGFDHPTMLTETLNCPPAMVMLPHGHRLTGKDALGPKDLDGEPFIAFAPTGSVRVKVDVAFEESGIRPNIVIEAMTAPNVAELVAAGLGVTVADPIAMEFVSDRVIARKFEPSIEFEYSIVRPKGGRNRDLVGDFVAEVHLAASKPKFLV